jgi:hypothetical protein
MLKQGMAGGQKEDSPGHEAPPPDAMILAAGKGDIKWRDGMQRSGTLPTTYAKPSARSPGRTVGSLLRRTVKEACRAGLTPQAAPLSEESLGRALGLRNGVTPDRQAPHCSNPGYVAGILNG